MNAGTESTQRRVGRHLRVVKTSKLSQTDGMRLLSGPNFSYFATIAHPCIHIQIEPKRKKFGISDGRKQLKYLLSEVIKIFDAIRKKYFRFYSDEEAFCQMYHMCVAEPAGSYKKYSFLCPNGTIFNQETLVCSPWFKVFKPENVYNVLNLIYH